MSESESEVPEWKDYTDDKIEEHVMSIRMEMMTEIEDLRAEIAKLRACLDVCMSSNVRMRGDTMQSCDHDASDEKPFELPAISITGGPAIKSGQSALGGMGAWTTKSERIETLKDNRRAKVNAVSGHP